MRTNSESSSKLEEKEIERERIHSCVCVHKTHTDALFYARVRFIVVRILFLAACVRSSAGRLIPVVWSSEGFIYDCLQQTSEADTTVGSDFLSVPNPHNHLPHIFSLSLSLLRLFFVIATRWKEEREEEDVDDDEAPSARRL